MDKGHEVSIASSGSALILLKQEFPTLQFFEWLVGWKVVESSIQIF
jgi:hypothetical protein